MTRVREATGHSGTASGSGVGPAPWSPRTPPAARGRPTAPGRFPATGALLAAAAGLVLGCAAPLPPPRGARPVPLYVADEDAGTLVLLDGASGRPLARPRPAGPTPAQAVVAPNGAALVRSGGGAPPPGPGGRDPAGAAAPALTYLPPDGVHPAAQPALLEPGARVQLLAGDGGDYAAVVYTVPDATPGAPGGAAGAPLEAPCSLALVDLRSGAVEATYPLCTPREVPTGLTLERTAGGPVATVALWHRATPADRAFLPAGARLLRLAAATGAPLGEAPVEGLPRPPAAGGSLLLAPGPAGGTRLYAVEALPGSQLAAWDEAEYRWQFPLAAAWRLRRLVPESLEPEAEVRLAVAPAGFAVAPDGATAYAFDALGPGLVEIDLATGRTGEVARLPVHHPWGLAVTAERLYVASPADRQVWAFDRQRGRRAQVLRVGRAPTAIGLAP